MNVSFVDYHEFYKVINNEDGLITVEMPPNQSIHKWVDDNKIITYNRTLDAINTLLFDKDIDIVYLIHFKISPSKLDGKTKHILISISFDEIPEYIDNMFEWAIESEEYEMCERIKKIKEIL
jgi:hypothetical protein